MMQSVEDEDGGRGNFDGSTNPAFVSDDDKVAAEASEATSNGDLPNPKPKVNPFSIQE